MLLCIRRLVAGPGGTGHHNLAGRVPASPLTERSGLPPDAGLEGPGPHRPAAAVTDHQPVPPRGHEHRTAGELRSRPTATLSGSSTLQMLASLLVATSRGCCPGAACNWTLTGNRARSESALPTIRPSTCPTRSPQPAPNNPATRYADGSAASSAHTCPTDRGVTGTRRGRGGAVRRHGLLASQPSWTAARRIVASSP